MYYTCAFPPVPSTFRTLPTPATRHRQTCPPHFLARTPQRSPHRQTRCQALLLCSLAISTSSSHQTRSRRRQIWPHCFPQCPVMCHHCSHRRPRCRALPVSSHTLRSSSFSTSFGYQTHQHRPTWQHCSHAASDVNIVESNARGFVLAASHPPHLPPSFLTSSSL